MLKRWIPFIMLIFTAAVLSMYLFLMDQTELYTPAAAAPDIVYREACARCHGERGEGGALLYPGLSGNRDSAVEVADIVRHGGLFMPAFPNIPDTVLAGLAEYVAGKQYLRGVQDDLKR